MYPPRSFLGFILASGLAASLAGAQCTTPCFGMYDDTVFDSAISTGGPNLLIGIKIQVPSSLVAMRLEVFTGKQNGNGVVEIWSHDSAGNKPAARLAGGSYLQAANPDWQGANLDKPQVLAANTDYWFVWGMPSGSQSSIRQRHATSQGQTYRGSFDSGQTWNGPFSFYEWKLRIYCCQRFPGVFAPFGTSCGPRGQIPQIGNAGVPTVGKSYQVTVGGTIPSRPAMLTLGLSKSAWGPFTLPLDLTLAGAAGCTLLCSIDVSSALATDAAGAASAPIPVPNDSKLVGLDLYHQWLIFSPAANTFGALFSNGANAKLGS